MAMFERALFNKPIAMTKQNMSSGVSSDIATGTLFFGSPWAKLMYLKRIEAYGPSGVIIELWDNFSDAVTGASGFEKRKDLKLIPSDDPTGYGQLIEDIDEDIPILGDIYAFPSLSGVYMTIAARTM
jgi:hypothetical protein